MRLTFRTGMGAFFALVGFVFLVISSVILARGAARWALSPWDKLAYGTVAASVPWVIALMPFLVAATWRRGRWTGRPTLWTLAGCAIWLCFVGYNLLGAGGAVSFTRADAMAGREHDASTVKNLKDSRQRYTTLLDAIPAATRPTESVEPLIAAQKISPWWGYTEGCRTQSNAKERRFCTDYQKLEAELGAAKEQARLTGLIAEIDGKLLAEGAVADVIDPQAKFIAHVMGWSEERVQEWLPLATPAILELGSITLFGFAILLLDLSHSSIFFGERAPPTQAPAPAVAVAAGAAAPLPVVQASPAAPVPNAALTRQVELARWFFANCVRHVASGSMPEQQWYAHYVEICARSNDVPLPVESFRRIAAPYIPSIVQIEGQVYYQRVLPLLPANAA